MRAYESLRVAAETAEPGGGGEGLALLWHEGVAAWMAALSELVPSAPAALSAMPLPPPPPAELRGGIIHALTAMALAHLERSRS